MDVKYIPKDWEKMREGIGDLIGLGRWGKGMIDSLKDLSDNLEDIEQLIAKYDSDGVIPFHHTSQKSNYQALYEDFQVLHRFTGKVGDIVDRTIDERFYKDIDAFVEEMRDLSISNYTTKNRLGLSETVHITAGTYNSVEIEKPEISLDDIFNGDNFYGKQMKLEYEAWKEQNPNQDFSQKEYQQAIVNTRAFEYESIRDTQENKEFWFQIGTLVVIIGATLICPPAGMALGAVYGAYELSSAVSGKDLVSGRELGTSERWVRGLLAPLDIVPGVRGLTKFSSTVRLAGVSDNMGKLGLSSGVKGGVQQGATSGISNLVETASKFGTDRLRRAEAAFQNGANIVKNKVIKDTIEVAQVADKGVAGLRKYLHVPREEPVLAGFGLAGKPRDVIENTHTIENGVKILFNTSDGVKVGSGGTKGAGNVKKLDDVPRIKEIQVNFKRNVKHDSEEFARQLKDQEKGMNELTVEEYLKNREKYLEHGRAIEGNAAQQAAREKALNKKIEELFENGMSWEEAEIKANSWLKTQAALHNPDQIAGGNPLNIGGMGDKRINSSIGSQWKYRIDVIDEKIGELAQLMKPEQRKNTYLNVKLTY